MNLKNMVLFFIILIIIILGLLVSLDKMVTVLNETNATNLTAI